MARGQYRRWVKLVVANQPSRLTSPPQRVRFPNWASPAAKMADMDVERMQEHCLAKPGAWADNPWNNDFPVVKVGEGQNGKIFAFLGSGGVGLKGGPTRDVADEWLERYPGDVKVMAYIGRAGWNDLSFRGEIPDDELLEAVDVSYRLVVSGLPVKDRPAGWEVASAPAQPDQAEQLEADELDDDEPDEPAPEDDHD
jgi:predicted DNA-binding protein (MmcQ/YjbR family)